MTEDDHFKEIQSLSDQRVTQNSTGRQGHNLGTMRDLNREVDQIKGMKKFKGPDIGTTEKMKAKVTVEMKPS